MWVVKYWILDGGKLTSQSHRKHRKLQIFSYCPWGYYHIQKQSTIQTFYRQSAPLKVREEEGVELLNIRFFPEFTNHGSYSSSGEKFRWAKRETERRARSMKLHWLLFSLLCWFLLIFLNSKYWSVSRFTLGKTLTYPILFPYGLL